MDGFDTSAGVIILGATNRPEILDPALLRAGRFDRQVLVDRPDLKGRIDVLKVHARKVKPASDVDLTQVAAMTPGFAGADLANLVNEAALLATRRGAEAVTTADLTAAIERIVAGLEKKTRVLNSQERQTVAYHEMGHALVAMALPGMDPVQKVSIIPRGISALGYTIQRPTGDRFLMSRQAFPAVAERSYSEQTAREIDCAVRDMVYDAFQAATGILTQARAILERGALAVLEKESIGEVEVAQLKNELERTLELARSQAPAPLEAGPPRQRAVG